jgi:hypothetical protein
MLDVGKSVDVEVCIDIRNIYVDTVLLVLYVLMLKYLINSSHKYSVLLLFILKIAALKCILKCKFLFIVVTF